MRGGSQKYWSWVWHTFWPAPKVVDLVTDPGGHAKACAVLYHLIISASISTRKAICLAYQHQVLILPVEELLLPLKWFHFLMNFSQRMWQAQYQFMHFPVYHCVGGNNTPLYIIVWINCRTPNRIHIVQIHIDSFESFISLIWKRTLSIDHKAAVASPERPSFGHTKAGDIKKGLWKNIWVYPSNPPPALQLYM